MNHHAISARGAWMLDGLAKSSAIFTRDADVALSYKTNFWLQALGTVISVFVTSMIALAGGNHIMPGGETYFTYLAINMAFMRFQMTALSSFGESIRESQLAGTLEVMLVTPTSLPLLILSAGLWPLVYCCAQTALFLGVSLFLGLDIAHANVPCVLVFFALTAASIVPLGVIAASLTIMFKKSGPVEFFFSNATLLFGGVFLPVERLPHAFQGISWLLPITHALSGLRAGFAGAPLSALVPDALWLCVAPALLMPISLYAFARAIRVARFDGTLGSY